MTKEAPPKGSKFVLAPDSWGVEPLSAYLKVAEENRYATFVRKREAFARLGKVDWCFRTIHSDDWINPRPIICAMLFDRAMAAYRSACSSAMAGDIVGSFVMIRAMLENAGYSAHISRDDTLSEIWLRRHDGDAGMAGVKNAFKVSNIRASIKALDRAAEPRFHKLYNEAIDAGAHPNERSVTGNMTMADREDGGRKLQSLILQGDGLYLDNALLSVARAGLCALEILLCVFPARFELLGVKEKLLALRREPWSG